MAIHQQLHTAQEFWQMAETLDDDKQYELVAGEITEMPPSSPENTIVAVRITAFLFNFVDSHDLGYVTGADGGYTLDEKNVRIPDVAFISKERAPEIPKHFDIAPDLAIEVISPSQTAAKVRKKKLLYLESGVRMVWNFYVDERMVEVWRIGADGKPYMQPFGADDTLDGGDVLPGFTLAVSKIFPKDN